MRLTDLHTSYKHSQYYTQTTHSQQNGVTNIHYFNSTTTNINLALERTDPFNNEHIHYCSHVHFKC